MFLPATEIKTDQSPFSNAETIESLLLYYTSPLQLYEHFQANLYTYHKVSYVVSVSRTLLMGTPSNRDPFFSLDLHLTFTFDLDKDIDVQLRRMFFYDEVTRSKVVFLRQNTTLAQPNTTYEVLRKTVYIKVWQNFSQETIFLHLVFKNLKLS